MKIAIVGAGSLGIVFGAKLAQTGHQIFFLKKAGHHSPPEVVTCAQQKGQTIKAHAAITTLDQLPGMEASAICVRYENLNETINDLSVTIQPPATIIFSPVLNPNELNALKEKTSVAVANPQVAALPPQDNTVSYKLLSTIHVLSATADTAAQILWVDLLNQSGFKATASPQSVETLCGLYAFGIPLLSGLEKANYDVQALRHNFSLLKLSWQAAQEGLAAARLQGIQEPKGPLRNNMNNWLRRFWSEPKPNVSKRS